MLVHHKGHAISVSIGIDLSAELTALSSGTLLPTKATATLDEGAGVLLDRAKELVDLYLTPSTAQLLASNPEHSDAKSS